VTYAVIKFGDGTMISKLDNVTSLAILDVMEIIIILFLAKAVCGFARP
jgi:hypothetical protein